MTGHIGGDQNKGRGTTADHFLTQSIPETQATKQAHPWSNEMLDIYWDRRWGRDRKLQQS